MTKNRRRVHVRWQGKHRTEIDIRGVHKIQGDETPEYGGDDTGPMPTELLLAGVASCLCLAVAVIAKKMRKPIEYLTVDASAEKDMKEFRFHEIQLLVNANLPQEVLDPIVDKAKGYCFVSNTLLEGCGIQVIAHSSQPEQETDDN
jgi:putative redox protein